jgi:Ca2+:H+ antiporter
MVESPEEVETVVQADDSAEDAADEADLSDAESFTLKDRQDAINVTHPFGIRIWKPALYKKDRSVQQSAEDDVHSAPGGQVNNWLFFFNFLWTALFGWWLALLCAVGALLCLLVSFVSESCIGYGVLLIGLAQYLFYPFGKFVKLAQDEAYAEEDEGEGRSISEYEQWQNGDLEEGRLFFGPVYINRSLIGRRRTSVDSNDETRSLLGRTTRGVSEGGAGTRAKRRLFGRGEWNIGRVIFFLTFYGLITPSLLLVSLFCWFFVFTIPMGKVTLLLVDHLRRRPLALSFHSESADTRYPGEAPSSILVCTYRAVGSRYWKYTIDGTNIFLFNLLALVGFTIFDFYVLDEALNMGGFLTNQGFIFGLALFSIIPLAYFIGQAVASISAQSSMGVGATINALFSTIVEVYLYCVALNEGKHALVEGSIIGSIFAGILFLPGLSMCFGALKRKTQRFNVKSAGVTSTMLLFAMIGAFGPTLFYQIYGSVSWRLDDSKSSQY